MPSSAILNRSSIGELLFRGVNDDFSAELFWRWGGGESRDLDGGNGYEGPSSGPGEEGISP